MLINKNKVYTAKLSCGMSGRALFDHNRVALDYTVLEKLQHCYIFKFARRSFTDAKRMIFHYDHGSSGYYSGETYLCAEKCRAILGVGKKTKQFSLWYKIMKGNKL